MVGMDQEGPRTNFGLPPEKKTAVFSVPVQKLLNNVKLSLVFIVLRTNNFCAQARWLEVTGETSQQP